MAKVAEGELKWHKGSMLEKRLLKELQELKENPPNGITIRPVDDDQWDGTKSSGMLGVDITGPPGTPYEGGVFHLLVTFPDDYLHKPPRLQFTTPIFHPSISAEGRPHMRILKDDWSPAFFVSKLVQEVRSLLENISNFSPGDSEDTGNEAAIMLREDRSKFEEVAASCTRDHAVPKRSV